MGFKRLIKKAAFGGGNLIEGHIIDAAVKSVSTKKSFRKCLKESIEETYKEDMPGLRDIYREGEKNGRKQGTKEQAQRDESKFRKMVEEHENDRMEWEEQKKEYEDFLDDLDPQM